MTPETPQTIDGALLALAIAAIGSFTLLVVPAFNKWLASIFNRKAKEEETDDDLDTKENLLDLETRELTNKLALKAFDREEQLARLKAEYEAQSELLRLTREELKTCRDVQVTEYQRHEAALLAEMAKREQELLAEIAARETTIKKLMLELDICYGVIRAEHPSNGVQLIQIDDTEIDKDT